MLKLKWNYKLAIVLNIISLILIIKEVLMGETILGNVIFLGLVIIFSSITILLLAYDIVKKTNSINILLVTISLIFVSYAIWMFYSGRVPAGYGP